MDEGEGCEEGSAVPTHHEPKVEVLVLQGDELDEGGVADDDAARPQVGHAGQALRCVHGGQGRQRWMDGGGWLDRGGWRGV